MLTDPAVVAAILVAAIPGVLSYIATMRKESRSDARAQADRVAEQIRELQQQVSDCERRREEAREKWSDDRAKLIEKVAELRGELRAFERYTGVWRPRKKNQDPSVGEEP